MMLLVGACSIKYFVRFGFDFGLKSEHIGVGQRPNPTFSLRRIFVLSYYFLLESCYFFCVVASIPVRLIIPFRLKLSPNNKLNEGLDFHNFILIILIHEHGLTFRSKLKWEGFELCLKLISIIKTH